MERSLYIFSDGEIKRKGHTLYFESDGQKKYIPVENCKEILIFGEVTFNKKFLEFISQEEIILHYFSHYGYYMGTFYPREHYNSGYMIIKQAEHYMDIDKRMYLAKRFVDGAFSNMLKVLQYYQRRGKNLAETISAINSLKKQIPIAKGIPELMAIEGNGRGLYYRAFDRITEDAFFQFETRSKRPPKNRMNALISFGNSIVYTAVLSEIYKTHLDPRIGFLHTSNFRRFSLNLDLAEIFKPIIVDRVIFTLINKKMLNPKMFEEKLSKVILNDKGKKAFIEEMENRFKSTIKHKNLKRNVSYRQLILLEAYKLEKHLIGEKDYQPYEAQW